MKGRAVCIETVDKMTGRQTAEKVRKNMRRAFLFNAEFEDHAEHVYAQFIKEHPERPAGQERIGEKSTQT
jgi:hypothetical protein